MSCDHDFRLEGIRQVYIDDELSGSIDFYRCINCGAIELAARKAGEETEQTYGFNRSSDKWYVVFDGEEWNIVRKVGEQFMDIDGKTVDLNGKKMIEIKDPVGEIRFYKK